MLPSRNFLAVVKGRESFLSYCVRSCLKTQCAPLENTLPCDLQECEGTHVCNCLQADSYSCFQTTRTCINPEMRPQLCPSIDSACVLRECEVHCRTISVCSCLHEKIQLFQRRSARQETIQNIHSVSNGSQICSVPVVSCVLKVDLFQRQSVLFSTLSPSASISLSIMHPLLAVRTKRDCRGSKRGL